MYSDWRRSYVSDSHICCLTWQRAVYPSPSMSLVGAASSSTISKSAEHSLFSYKAMGHLIETRIMSCIVRHVHHCFLEGIKLDSCTVEIIDVNITAAKVEKGTRKHLIAAFLNTSGELRWLSCSLCVERWNFPNNFIEAHRKSQNHAFSFAGVELEPMEWYRFNACTCSSYPLSVAKSL